MKTSSRAPGLGGRAAEWLYRAGLAVAARARRAPLTVEGAAVLSVGNLEAGGAGKTPCVLWWARALVGRGVAAAVVCRPWGPPAGPHPGDECALLAQRLRPGVQVHWGANKLASATRAAREGARVVVVDDGFSHRALARDLDLVLLDARRPFGNGRCLPAGPLREPPEALARASVVALSRADRADADERRRAREMVRAVGFEGPILHARHRVAGVRGESGVRAAAGEAVYCLSGIARPGELAEAATRAGLSVRGHRSLPDHHAFTSEEWKRARAEAERLGARLLITAKDQVRLSPEQARDALVLEVEWEWMEGDLTPDDLLDRLLQAIPAA